MSLVWRFSYVLWCAVGVIEAGAVHSVVRVRVHEPPHPHPHPPHLSLSIDTPPSASPFPSPSSSFLPPPVPGAHEFAMKPVPAAARRRVESEEDPRTPLQNGNGRALQSPATPRAGSAMSTGLPVSPAATTPTVITPTAASSASSYSSPPTSTSTSSTPASASLTSTAAPPSSTPPAPATPSAKRVSFPPSASVPPSSSASTTSTPTSSSFPLSASSAASDVPSSTRPAPPSPALSRRTSAVPGGLTRTPSSASSRGSHSQSRRTSRVLAGARHRLSMSTTAADVADALSSTSEVTSTSESAPTASSLPDPPISVRDFAFAPSDARHVGLGPDVPPACDPRRLAQKLLGHALPDADEREYEPEWEDDDGPASYWGGGGEGSSGQGGFLLGRGRMTVPASYAGEGGEGDGVGPADFARNFVEPEDGLYYEEAYLGEMEGTYKEEDDPEGAEQEMEPGLYRAAFRFEALDGAEMDLVEGQLLCVVSGGASGWAVVRAREPPLVLRATAPPGAPTDADADAGPAGLLEVNARIGSRTDVSRVWEELWAASTPPNTEPVERRGLVPASFIVLVRGDGEGEAEAKERLEAYIAWVEEERRRQEAEAAAEAAAEAEAEAAAAATAQRDTEESDGDDEYEDALEGPGGAA
ncbi:hypothetical protein FB451DRAFT_1549473 [Mycena latifolia]|nr:hypothetical protein FB451DRAFT_1549473 [Mycena latifolia]